MSEPIDQRASRGQHLRHRLSPHATRLLGRILVVAGTVFAATPLVVPMLLAAARSPATGVLQLDWLLPGELFPLVVIGGVALAVGAFVIGRRQVLATIVAGATVLAFAGTDVAARATGVAFGVFPATGWRLAVIVTALGVYLAAVVLLVVVGVVLARDAFTPIGRRPPPGGTADR